MKRRELMAIVALAAGLSSSMAATSNAYAGPKAAAHSNGQTHPGHFIGKGHFEHGNGHGYGHNHHDHDIY